MTYSKLHGAARAYAEKGWPVFPIHQNAKTPACANGFKDATIDLATIDKWWGEANYNIGFCPENAGMCVIDVDPDGEWIDVGVHTVKTPRGRHWYYANSLPPTASKIAPHVDTRGRDSYVLLPPSVINNLPYEWETEEPCEAWELKSLDPWVANMCERPKTEPRTRTVTSDDVTDRPQAIKAFKQYLEKHPIPPEGEGSDDAIYRAICRGRDFGLSDDCILEFLGAATNFDPDWLWEKLSHAEAYQQNEPGCDAPPTASDYAKFAANAPAATASERPPAQEIDDWIPHDPRDPADMPELEFFDEDRMIPKSPEGAVGIIYGKRGDHKTNTLLSMLSSSDAQRLLYAAGEGAYGVERDRIAARPSINGRIKVLSRVPLFSNPQEVQSFLEGSNAIAFKPEIVVLDTMATVLAGEDEQSAVTASYLTDNGPAGIIKRAWNCTLILIAHAGKDASRGVRGSSAFEGNVDFVLLVEANKDNATIKVTCEKMRDGYDQHSSYWKYAKEGVPVPERISQKEYDKLNRPAPKPDETAPIGMMVKAVLRRLNAFDWQHGLTRAELAHEMTVYENGDRPGETGDDGVDEWDTKRAKWQQSIKDAEKSAWGKKCTDSKVQRGGKEMVLRWFAPPDQSSDL